MDNLLLSLLFVNKKCQNYSHWSAYYNNPTNNIDNFLLCMAFLHYIPSDCFISKFNNILEFIRKSL